MKRIRVLLFALLNSAMLCHAAELNLMPWPTQIEQSPDFLVLDHAPRFQVTSSDPLVRQTISHFTEQLSKRTGVPSFSVEAGKGTGPAFIIHCDGSSSKVQTLGEDESYRLVVDTKQVELTAPNPLGILRGVETLLQLVQPGQQSWIIPAIRIEDRPRFPWRGLMIDVSRHFMPVDAIKRNLDGMAAVKLNVLHLHLSDEEGFRIESHRCPKLQELASNGQFYTQAQVREIVSYAHDRGIRVVPEFDVPAHAVDILIAYPELSSSVAPSRLVRDQSDLERPPIDPTSEKTYKLLDRLFGEMTSLFPDKYFHIGGDEVDGKYWDRNERIQTWMHAHDIKDNHALQAYFNKRMQKILAKYGKHMEGWDEILAPDLPKDALIQSWRGPASLAEAARGGFQTILSAGWYLDLMYPAAMHYAVDPMTGESASLSPEEKNRILGGEAAQWAEYVTPENLDNRIWPRMGAIAERLWSQASVTDVASMYRRLSVLNRNLDGLDLRHRSNSRRMLERIAGDAPLELIETLASAVEPVKEYARETTQPFSVDAPYNRLVDAVPPESMLAREASELAQRAIQYPSVRPQLRTLFMRWRENDVQLQPFLPASLLLSDLAPLSHDLSVLGSVGLDALDVIESGSAITADKHTQQLAAVDESAKPHAELLLAVAPAIRHLVEVEPVSP